MQHRITLALSWLISAALATAVTPAQTRLILHPGSTVSTAVGADAPLGSPQGIAFDTNGNLYVADARNHIVLRQDADGKISIVAGNGQQGFAGDGGPATASQLNAPQGIAISSTGTLYIADTGNHAVRKVDATGTISTVAPALRMPVALALSTVGDLYIADAGDHRIRKFSANGTLTAIAGTGEEGDQGDNGPATAATFRQPSGIAFLPDGRLLIADRSAQRLRILNVDGTITAYPTPSLRHPQQISTDAQGNVYIADAGNHTILQIAPDGASVIAGTGEQGALTPGDPLATPADSPSATAPASNGTVLYSDRRNHQIQSITLATLAFGNVNAGKASAPQALTLQNGGTQPLQVTAIDLPNGFTSAPAPQNGCSTLPFTLAANTSCILNMTFAPTIQGPQSGLALLHVAGAAPQSVLLTGTGTAAGTLEASTTSLHTDGTIGYAGTPVVLTAAVTGGLNTQPSGIVTFYDGATSLGTAILNAGTAQLATAALQQGTHAIHAVYSGDASYSTSTSSTLNLTVVPAPDFTLTGTANSYTGAVNSAVTVPVTLLPVNGTLNQPVTFSVTGLPTGATSTFTPSTLTLGGDKATVTLNVQLPATIAHNSYLTSEILAGTLLLALFTRRRRAAALLSLSVFATTAIGCGSGGFRGGSSATTTGTTPQTHTYAVAITATTIGVLGQPLVHTTTFNLTVTP